jgi:hypothetical protein
MGACVAKNSKQAKLEKEVSLNKSWMRVSNCIDKFRFESKINISLYDSLQVNFTIKTLELKFPESESQSYNIEFINSNKAEIEE